MWKIKINSRELPAVFRDERLGR